MKEIIPETQGIAVVALFVIGNTLIFALGGFAGPDIWLAFLVGIVLSLPMMLLYARLTSLMHDETFSSGLTRLFGKWPSRAVTLGYSGFAWYLASLVVGDITNFIQAVSLPTTPQVALAMSFVVLVLWAVKSGVEVLARFSAVMIKPVFVVLFSVFVLLASRVDLENFLPIMYDGIGPVFLGALQLMDFPFLEVIFLFWFFDGFTRKSSSYKVFVQGFLIGAVVLFLVHSASLAVLGPERFSSYYFPVDMAISRIDVSEFLTRLEAIVTVTLAVGSFLKIAVCLLVASKGLAHTLGFSDYRFLVTPLALATIPGSRWFVSSIMDIEAGATKVISASTIVFLYAMPVILWIIAEVRTAQSKKAG